MRGVRVMLVAAGLVAGCAKSEERLYTVSGTVTFNGKPVPMGLVFFDPDTSKGNSGRQGFANIQGGKFTTAQGVRGGGSSTSSSARAGTATRRSSASG